MENLIVSKEKIVNLFRALGYKTVDKWNDVRLQGKITNLPKLLGDEKIDLKPKKKTLLKTILKTLKKKGRVLIKEVVEAEKTFKAFDEKLKTKKSKMKDKKVKSKKAKKSIVKGKNRFGHCLGTQGAKIDESISTKPKTLKTIRKESKLTLLQVRVHLASMVRAGLVKKTDKGYVEKATSKKR